MKLKNILIVVKDIEKSIKFYKELFGLSVVNDFGENVIMTEGLVLQEVSIWEKAINTSVIFKNNCAELYFEENDIEAFVKKIEESDFEINYVNKLTQYEWGQRVVRIYDLDGHIIEVRENMEFVRERNSITRN